MSDESKIFLFVLLFFITGISSVILLSVVQVNNNVIDVSKICRGK